MLAGSKPPRTPSPQPWRPTSTSVPRRHDGRGSLLSFAETADAKRSRPVEHLLARGAFSDVGSVSRSHAGSASSPSTSKWHEGDHFDNLVSSAIPKDDVEILLQHRAALEEEAQWWCAREREVLQERRRLEDELTAQERMHMEEVRSLEDALRNARATQEALIEQISLALEEAGISSQKRMALEAQVAELRASLANSELSARSLDEVHEDKFLEELSRAQSMKDNE
eukprot:gnl/TRDRNA2_/TRDRNA2_127132_c0_seq1.p1 gnl/TRDRNA2_/TRDRNA2_127132_c0~~gnl/TRDRNA2_/TRDRNA2_127132_c0_seq1.p1  ORF type:complete len:226 (+),score=53.05 gnl/TRDRNA2_/TRDRNA2_127132_c0_seq1:94-771(+)